MTRGSIYRACKQFKVGDQVNVIKTTSARTTEPTEVHIKATIISRHPRHLVIRHLESYTESFTYADLLTGNSSRVRMEKAKR